MLFRSIYNQSAHESLAGKTPHERFYREGAAPLRPVESEDWLRERFTLTESRVVSADHVIKYGGQLWEVPRGLARQEIPVFRRLLEGEDALYVNHQGALIRLHRLDVHANATFRRAQPIEPEAPAREPVPTASMRRYARDHASLLAPDGGFQDPTPEDHDKELP